MAKKARQGQGVTHLDLELRRTFGQGVDPIIFVVEAGGFRSSVAPEGRAA